MSGCTIYVRLLDEGVDVWRPVMATRIDAGTYRVSNQEIPDDEVWEFQPGSLVAVTEKAGENGKYLIAVQLKS